MPQPEIAGPLGGGTGAEPLLARPLSARSLIASLLLRSRPSRMQGARLVQWCGLFGVAEGTARVALSRMVERGELLTAVGAYELAGRVQSRRSAQDWSLDPELSRWDGSWKVAVVGPSPREAADRAALRDAMRRMRFATLREGVWTRPDNLRRESAPAEAWAVADAQCSWWSGAPADDAAALATGLFDPSGWSRRGEMLVARVLVVTRAFVGADDRSLAEGFVTGAACLAHIRADPLLPPELADVSVGVALRAAYRTYETAFSAALRLWFVER
jgi:phenylacetic acid degradation operon negative regulatory protein